MSADEQYTETTKKYDEPKKEAKDYQFGPPPSTQDKPPHLYRQMGEPNELYTYKNIKGEIEFIVFRNNTKAKKEIKPWTYSHAVKGWVNALPKGKGVRTLYNADNLADTIEQEKRDFVKVENLAEILIVEGEKTCNRASEIFTAPVILTWSNGTKSIEQSDWSILTGRKIYLWPDHDKTGYEAMIKIAKKLSKNNTVFFVELKQSEFPLGWDLADSLPIGISKAIYQNTLNEALHWLKVQDTINPKKFDMLNPSSFVWVEEPKRFRVLNENIWLDKDQLNFRYGKYNPNPFNHLKKQGVPMAWTTAYYPNRPMIFQYNGIKLLNAYTGPDIVGVERDITPWLKDLEKFFLKDGDDLHYYNQTIAHLVQKPEEKRTWCHHKGGVQGNGKSVKDLVVSYILGHHHCNKITNEILFSDFNDYLENKLVIFIEELNIDGKKKSQMMNKIKDPISSEEHLINKKMVPLYKHYCPTKWFSNSNYISPIYLEASDRRFYIYWSKAPKWEEDYTKFMVDHKKGWMWQKENLEGIRHYYEKYDLKGFNPSWPRMTNHKQSLIFHHEKDLFVILDEAWEEWDRPFSMGSEDIISTQQLAVWVRLDQLYGQGRKMWVSPKDVYEWAVTRGGKAMPRKSYRCRDKKKRNLVAMRHFEKWMNADEAKVKEEYIILPVPKKKDYEDEE